MQTLPDKPRVRVAAPSVRIMAAAVPEVETAYHAASVGAKDMATWPTMRLSPDAAMMNELDTIVARSEDLERNNGIAAGNKQTQVDNVVGPRVLLKPNPDRLALNRDADWVFKWSRIVESKWSSFADTVWFDAALRSTFHASSRLAFKSVVSSGELLALPLWLTTRGSRWNTAVQLVEPARLSNPSGRGNTRTLRNGVEIDSYGAPVAYNIRKSHPGDLVFGNGTGFLIGGEWERVPAYMPWGRPRVLHAFEADWIGQSRGVPLVAAVARQFKMLDHFYREKLRVAVLDAMIFASLETPLDQEAQIEMLGGNKAKDFKKELNEWRVPMKGGTIITTPIGTKLNAFTPTRPSGELDSFSEVMLRYIGAGLNLPYELVLKDFSKTNYSSARAALLEAWRYFYSCRQFLTDSWCAPVYELWFEEAVNRGEIPDCTVDDFYGNRIAWTRAKWIFAGRGWVDPVKEADAAVIRMDNSLSTHEDECAEQGKDGRDVLEQKAREMRYAKELEEEFGLQPGSLLRGKAMSGGNNYPSDQRQEQQGARAA